MSEGAWEYWLEQKIVHGWIYWWWSVDGWVGYSDSVSVEGGGWIFGWWIVDSGGWIVDSGGWVVDDWNVGPRLFCFTTTFGLQSNPPTKTKCDGRKKKPPWEKGNEIQILKMIKSVIYIGWLVVDCSASAVLAASKRKIRLEDYGLTKKTQGRQKKEQECSFGIL